MLDLALTSGFGRRVACRLREERLSWLVTIDSCGLPEPSLVWFWWDKVRGY